MLIFSFVHKTDGTRKTPKHTSLILFYHPHLPIVGSPYLFLLIPFSALVSPIISKKHKEKRLFYLKKHTQVRGIHRCKFQESPKLLQQY